MGKPNDEKKSNEISAYTTYFQKVNVNSLVKQSYSVNHIKYRKTIDKLMRRDLFELRYK